MNMDDCVVVGRDATGTLIADPLAFPRGIKSVATALNAINYTFGFYTVRNNRTCASILPGTLQRPGSYGHEAVDAAWYAANGVQYLKDDSCGNPEADYRLMRDALNATGAPIFFSLCAPGTGPANARMGRAVGNGWRVDEDDGGLWRPILDNVNMNAGLAAYSGCDEQHHDDGLGCGWNDMGLLMVGGGMTHDQDVSHMCLWAIMANKLLISVDPRGMKPEAVALLANAEIVAIDQDALKLQGERVVPPADAARAAGDAAHVAAWKAAHLPGGSWRAAGRAHELLAGGDAGAVPGTEEDAVLAAGGRAAVWQRRLAGGAWALLLFNNGVAGGATVACEGACWARMGWAPGDRVAVRDVVARADNGTAAGGFSAFVRANATVMVRLTRAA